MRSKAGLRWELADDETEIDLAAGLQHQCGRRVKSRVATNNALHKRPPWYNLKNR